MAASRHAHARRRLTIDLETASTALTLLGLGAGVRMGQFVARTDESEPMYTSATFTAPYSCGGPPIGRTISPDEEWARGMARALDDLRREIEDNGWVAVAHGRQRWETEYRST